MSTTKKKAVAKKAATATAKTKTRAKRAAKKSPAKAQRKAEGAGRERIGSGAENLMFRIVLIGRLIFYSQMAATAL